MILDIFMVNWTSIHTQKGIIHWRCRGLNPGPFTCKANALPLRYIPYDEYGNTLVYVYFQSQNFKQKRSFFPSILYKCLLKSWFCNFFLFPNYSFIYSSNLLFPDFNWVSRRNIVYRYLMIHFSYTILKMVADLWSFQYR